MFASIACFAGEIMTVHVVVKFEEFKKVQDAIKFEKIEIHIQSQLLSEDTQYSQYCNNVSG